MADTVTMTWTDATGTYMASFTIENPSLADVKTAYQARNSLTVSEEAREVMSEADFYAGLSQQLVNETLTYAQNYKHQQAVNAIPPIAITPVV